MDKLQESLEGKVEEKEDLFKKLKEYHKQTMEQNALFLLEDHLWMKEYPARNKRLPYLSLPTTIFISSLEELYYKASPEQRERLNKLIGIFLPKNI